MLHGNETAGSWEVGAPSELGTGTSLLQYRQFVILPLSTLSSTCAGEPLPAQDGVSLARPGGQWPLGLAQK